MEYNSFAVPAANERTFAAVLFFADMSYLLLFRRRNVASAGHCRAWSALTFACGQGIIVHPTVLHKYTVVNV